MSTRSQSKRMHTLDADDEHLKKKQKIGANSTSRKASSTLHSGSNYSQTVFISYLHFCKFSLQSFLFVEISRKTATSQNLDEKAQDEQVSGLCTVVTVTANHGSSSTPVPSPTPCPCKSTMISPVIDVVRPDLDS